jgi:hypothetical protein
MTVDGQIEVRVSMFTSPTVGVALFNCGLQGSLEPDGYWITDSASPKYEKVTLVCTGKASRVERSKAMQSIPAWTLGTLTWWLVRYARCNVTLKYDQINGSSNTVSCVISLPKVVHSHYMKKEVFVMECKQRAENVQLLVDDLATMLIQRWDRVKHVVETVNLQDEVIGVASGKL